MTFPDVFPHVSLAWGVIALGLLLLAWRRAVQTRFRSHRALMLVLVAGAWIFLISYLLQLRLGGQAPGLHGAVLVWMLVHGGAGLVTLLGVSWLAAARLWQQWRPASDLFPNRHHRRLGRPLVGLWVFSHLGGVVNYFLFY